jgi:hypothetical protein
MRRNTIVFGSFVALVAVGASVPAFAQSESDKNKSSSTSASSSSDQSDMLMRRSVRAPVVFVTGAFGTSQDRSSHFVNSVPGGLQTNLSGSSQARSFSVGTFLTPRLSVRFEMTLPYTLDVKASTSGTPVVSTLAVAETTRTGAILFGYHTSSARPVSMEYLGGVIFLSQRQNSISQVMTETGVPLAAPMESDAYSYRSAAVAGADVNVSLGRYIALVPEFRAWSLGGTFTTRSSIGFRVNF